MKKKTFNFVPLGNGVKDFGDVMSEPFSDCLIIERLSFVHIFRRLNVKDCVKYSKAFEG